MEDFFSEENTRAKLLRESSPLVISDGQHRFFHRSILEYFFSCRVFEPKKSSSEGDGSGDGLFYPELARFLDPIGILSIAKHPFGEVSLISEPSIPHFLVERVLQSESFKQQLIQIIRLSKDKPDVGRAAANAITILVRAGVHFNGVDFQGIQIPGADLSEGCFDSAQLQGADFTGVHLKRTWLRQADLRGATMTDVRFGEKPYFEVPGLCSVAISLDGKILAAGLWGEDVQIFKDFDFKPLHVYKGHSSQVSSMAISNDNLRVASGADHTVLVWHLKGGKKGGKRLELQSQELKIFSLAFAPNSIHLQYTSCLCTRRWNHLGLERRIWIFCV